MSKYMPVTVGQMECGRKIANEKRVGRARFQQALDDGMFARFLGLLNLELRDTKPPKGGRIHVLRVRVDQGREWQEAVSAAGPDTPIGYNVRKVGNLYVPVGGETVEEDIVILNFPNGDGNWCRAIAWAEIRGLRQTNPREVFAIAEQHPTLHTQLGQNMSIAATMSCAFGGDQGTCCVRWENLVRQARFVYIQDLNVFTDWFAFRKPRVALI